MMIRSYTIRVRIDNDDDTQTLYGEPKDLWRVGDRADDLNVGRVAEHRLSARCYVSMRSCVIGAAGVVRGLIAAQAASAPFQKRRPAMDMYRKYVR